MAIQKKHGKGRLDKWYKLAKEKGYRARAAFKLIQLNRKYGFLEKSKVLLDLCAAPGSWCQVAAEAMPKESLIVGVDLAPIKAIPRVITFQSDITTDKCRATIRSHFKSWKADTVLHDGAPNVGTAWVQDAFTQAELTLQAMKLATEFLAPGGTFVTKVFRSKDYNALIWVFNQLFLKVEATKPPSSRNVSAEIFVVCRGYKAPKHLDPKFVDPKAVFAELADPTPNNEAKVFNPEKKKRKREGYEEGDWTQYKELPAHEFIQTTDPIAILGSYNKLSFEQAQNGDIALATLNKLPETTTEVRQLCADLKVLGRRDFKVLLKWRLRVREIFGFASKKTSQQADSHEVAEVEELDDEMKLQEEMDKMNERESKLKKRERRRLNEKKQKDIVRMQLNMAVPTDIGLEQAEPHGEDAMFALKAVDKAGATNSIARGRMVNVVPAETTAHEEEEDESPDEEEDALERELDAMYEQYQESRASRDAKYRAKKARQQKPDGDWEGISEDEKEEDSDVLVNDDDDFASDDSEGEGMQDSKSEMSKLLTDGALSKKAAMFFDQDIFSGIKELTVGDDNDSALDVESPSDENSEERDEKSLSNDQNGKSQAALDEISEDEGFEVVKSNKSDWERQEDEEPVDIDIITAEAMTLAQQLASGQKTSQDLMDDGFNKSAFRDTDGLPDWFVEDENKHSKPHKPITKAAAAAIKEKLRVLNARPIKKVREAKDRKKFKAAKKLEKLRAKSALMADDENMTEKDKANSITKMMRKATKKAMPRKELKVVVARGSNRGIKGRPGGVKGRYKIVDARLRKDMRAMKRIGKKRK